MPAHSDRDAVRDAHLTAAGFRVLQFWNSDIDANFDGVQANPDRSGRSEPHPAAARPPSPKGEGGSSISSPHANCGRLRAALSLDRARSPPRANPMTEHSILDRVGIAPEKARNMVAEALEGADDGELYLEFSQSESLLFDNGRLKSASFDTNQGFGLRAVAGEAAGYAHSGEISEPSIKRAADAVQAVKAGHKGTYAEPPRGTNAALYSDENPLGNPTFAEKVKLLETIDATARKKDDRVRQVTASLGGSYEEIEIVRADGTRVRDIRPMVRLNVSVVVGEGDKQETGSYGTGGREGFARFVTEDIWQFAIDEAVRQALVNLSAVPALALSPSDVVLGPGWPAFLLKPWARGLEGDFQLAKGRAACRAFHGPSVAPPGVTVIDDEHDRQPARPRSRSMTRARRRRRRR